MELDLGKLCKELTPDKQGRLPLRIPGFYAYQRITPETFGRLLKSYAPVFHDNHTIEDMAIMINSSLVISNEAGWLAFTKIVPGVSAELHGARWGAKGTFHGAQAREVIDLVMNCLGLQVVRSKTAEHLESVKSWLTAAGFVASGYEPLVLSFDGTYRGLFHYSYWR